MKLLSSLVILTLAASTFSSSIPMKRQEYLSPSCQEELDKLEECDFEYYKDIDIICENFHTDKCQQFYKNGIHSLKGCKNDDPNSINFVQEAFDMTFPTYAGLCAIDENGEPCPVSALKINFTNEKISLENYYRNLEIAIRSTCKSKRCTDAYLEYEISEEAKKQIQQIRNSTNTNDTQKSTSVQNGQSNPIKRQVQLTELNTPHTQQAPQAQQAQQTEQTQQTGQTQPAQTQQTQETQPKQETQEPQKFEQVQQQIQQAQQQIQQQAQQTQTQIQQDKQQTQQQTQRTHSRYYEYQRAFEFAYNSAEYMISEECQSQIQTQPRSKSDSSSLLMFKSTTATILTTVGLLLYTLL